MRRDDDQTSIERVSTPANGMRSLVATLGPWHDRPWWWPYLAEDSALCPLEYDRLTLRGKHSRSVSILETPLVMLKVLRRLLQWRKRYDYVFTFECDLVGLSIAFWQSISGSRRPRHVILQFIMRERQATLASRLKYALMRFLFGSVYRVVVSSSGEVSSYQAAFGWPSGKVLYVPFHVDPRFLEISPATEQEYFLAAGRTFRDYETLARAVEGTAFELVIVGGRGSKRDLGEPDRIRILEDIPSEHLARLMRDARAVVLPLEDRGISTGQSVLLQAMGMGKAVVATRTVGTVDYVDHMVDGVLVPPHDVNALRDALRTLDDGALRARLGNAARSKCLSAWMPHHYSAGVREAVTGFRGGV